MGRILEEEKRNGGTVEDYLDGTDKFIKMSSTLSFIHHSIVITTILGLIAHDPCYFEHWACPKFILNNYGGFFYGIRYEMVGGIIGLGLFGLMSSLRLGARSLKILRQD